MCEFEKKVFENLKANGVSFSAGVLLGAAVSGGADSVSLLVALSKILSEYKLPLYVITVNHNIRSAEESGGDAEYVRELCKKLEEDCGIKICCEVVELKPGLVKAESEKRGRGIEEAARYFRYEAFDNFVTKNNLSALCLAHNKNDQLETVLMRFLQGASFDSAGGIKARRGSFVRPLLNIERCEIESYLNNLGIKWRTDSTNNDTDYLRNKIRHKLVPLLDAEFSGWQTGVLSGAERACEDSDFIKQAVETVPVSVSSDGSVVIKYESFMAQDNSVKKRVLLNACNLAGESDRIPQSFLMDVLTAISGNSEGRFEKHFNSIDICKEKNALFIKKHAQDNTDLVFFDIIEKTGIYEFPFGALNVYNIDDSVAVSITDSAENLSSCVEGLKFPFCVRSIQSDDMVKTADGTEKKVCDILSDWHIAAEKKPFVPVIQKLEGKSQPIKSVLAGFLGYKDWTVKNI